MGQGAAPCKRSLGRTLTWDHGTSFDQSYNQVNLDCLRDGVGVDRGGGGGGGRAGSMEQFFSQSSITYLSK